MELKNSMIKKREKIIQKIDQELCNSSIKSTEGIMLEIFYKKCKENRLNPLKEWKAFIRDARFIIEHFQEIQNLAKDDTCGEEKL